MYEINSFISNELLTGISILSVLKECGTMEYSKILLVEPILSYKRIQNDLKKKNCNILSIEGLIIKHKDVLTNFNERYKERLKLSIDSILLMMRLKLLSLSSGIIKYEAYDFNFKDASLGKAADDIIASGYKLGNLLKKEDANYLYLNLRVEL